ncbi:LysR family transcriptional regulator [Thalassotalea nanhaiensis]|uniref:LysR family transcriptional regulator n=1 Tax=Thalassotalea nanhaiensis TaxID=3065648 RepID=A0ABY9TEF6_9GAMM|nr:LysR family transcriptional regulator [Colwelliaceae bacterium SQ345]
MNLQEQRLSRIDLNLLISLSILLKEKNVTKAAQTLFVTQSAMSRMLHRLRELFDDPLFSRSSTGLVPTPRALQIEKHLPIFLNSLDPILASNSFDPKLCEDSFVISLPSILGQSMLPALFLQLSKESPYVNWTEYPASSNPCALLESATLDFAIHVAKDYHPTFISTPIGYAYPVIYVRKNHPLLRKDKVSLQDCMKFDLLNLIVESDDRIQSPVDSLLNRNNVKPKSNFKSSQMKVLTDILKQSDAIFIGMSYLTKVAEFSQQFEPIFMFEDSIENSIEFVLLQHERTKNSPAHNWFKEKLLTHLSFF